MENTIIVAMAMAVAITNIILLMKILSSEKKADAKTSGAKDGQIEISIMGKTKTQVTV